jgi:hypothetical protein
MARTEPIAQLDERATALSVSVRSLMDEIVGMRARLDEVREEMDDLIAAVESGMLSREQNEQALVVLQGLETAFTHSFEQAVGSIITRGLTLVRGEPWKFRIVHKLRGDVSAVDFRVTDPSGHETDVLTSHGEGLANLIDFLLRVLVILNSRPPMRRFLWLDESFAAVSDEYIPATAELLRQFVTTLGLQIVLTTHNRAFTDVADIVHLVEKRKGVGHLRLLKAHADLAVA